MINQTSEELITTAPASAAKPSNQNSKPQKLKARTFGFLWKRDSQRENALKKEENQKKKEDLVQVKIVESKAKNALSNKTSFQFFKNIKKHMQIKKFTTRKSKQKTKEIEASSLQNDTNCDPLALQKNESTISTEENNVSETNCENAGKNSEIISSNETSTATEVSQNECISESLNENVENYSDTEKESEIINSQTTDNLETDNNHENVPNVYQSCSYNETQHLQSRITTKNNVAEYQVENIEESTEANTYNDNRIKASLTEELLKLSNYGWYWGPISGNEADTKLISEPDGAFLVRDSSDDRYVLTLSFKSSGKLLHTRMEHSGGLFSLCNQSESEAFSSVADLIDHSMNDSQSGVFCYSRPKYPGHPSFPVRLTKPVSRFTQVRSLQYLCRFIIRQNTRLDNIDKLPLPKTLKDYIKEAHY
ncbi:Suppressor of cytokine signaling 6 [Habropoda laboriosa]|uniref:Suppressor of cytokine signaling 7 n=1 Tax=Habropoda laboriosa TaxID=597456 RepID=A0A0L7QX86_9HYME|nr:PREDICTED: suppressor of cytokine signaling 4-like [Habropoda laboriosa]KOC63154.1 Suppressor of cytokine signaling 6 [Habropoda laboriosa]